MEEEESGEWSVVGKKDKKGSPKAQRKQGVKRTDLQRSTSSNQVNTRRKLESQKSERDLPINDVNVANNARRKSARLVQAVNEDRTKLPESVTLVQDTITTIIDDVSSGIRRLSIDNNLSRPQDNLLKYKNSIGVEPRATSSIVLSTTEFCKICKKFNASRPASGRFQARGLLNTGCACFWNCIMQSLFSVTAFKSLLLELLQRLAVDGSSVHERLPAWREVLHLAAEFELSLDNPPVVRPEHNGLVSSAVLSPSTTAVASSSDPEVNTAEKEQASEARVTRSMASNETPSAHTAERCPVSEIPTTEIEPVIPRVEVLTQPQTHLLSASRHMRTSPIAATSLMSSLFQIFQRQMDGISGVTRDYTAGADNRKNKKNGQQDAMEFLTFLLDTLHEEIVRCETESSSTENGLTEEGIPRQDSLEMEIALTRQNSLSVDAQQDDDEGWSTVSKSTKSTPGKSKVKAVVVDKESKDRAAKASKASVISALFHFTLRSEVVYNVKKTSSVTFQQTHCITLDVNAPNNGSGSGRSIELLTCLAKYFAEENIDEGKVRKQIKLDSVPEVLILQLGRFSFDYHKNIPIKIQNNVEYPAKLELPAAYLSDELRTRSHAGPPQYELQAVVLHHGKKATGGHYSAFTLDTQQPASAAAAVGASKLSPAPAPVSIPGLPPSAVATSAKNKNNKFAKVNAAAASRDNAGSRGTTIGVNDESCAPLLRATRVWRSVNDSKINVINESQALGAQDSVYILFYQKLR